MKKVAFSALALSLTTAAGSASESEWSQLDKEVEALSMSLAQGGDGPTISGRIFAIYQNSDLDAQQVGGEDLGGFSVADARVKLEGEVGGYSYVLQQNFGSGFLADGGSGLLDAYIDIPIGELSARVGQYRPPILMSGLTRGDRLVFMDRTELGKLFSGRDTGVQLSGNFDALSWWLTVMNGTGNGAGDEVMIAGRAAFDFLGGGSRDSAGSLGASDDPSGTVAVAYFNDRETDGDGVAIEAVVATSVYSVSAEIAPLGGDNAGELYAPNTALSATFGGTGNASLIEGDSTPFSVAGTYMLVPDQWELAARFQGTDAAGDTDKIDVAITRYIQGHDLKYTAQFSNLDSDVDAIDGTYFMFGLNLTF